MTRGMVQIYTGDGKGKTTAALGLCFRAAGWGIRSAFIQFMKGRDTGEIHSAARLSGLIDFEQFGITSFLTGMDSAEFDEHLAEAERGLSRAEVVLRQGAYSIIVLDEILNLVNTRLATDKKIIELISLKPEGTELILTGRGASEKIIEQADLVTEMKLIKHYYGSGIDARRGIEY